MTRLDLLYAGRRFKITAYRGDDGRCEVIEFLEDRQILPETEERAFRALFALHGDFGPIRNQEKCRFLGEGIWEYKTRRGGRIAWFYLEGAIVVCACAVVKKKQKADSSFIRHARTIQVQCLAEMKNV